MSGTGTFSASILDDTNQVKLQIPGSGVLNILGLLDVIIQATPGPVGQTLDVVSTPLFEILGIQLGYVNIRLLSLDRNIIEPVYRHESDDMKIDRWAYETLEIFI